MQSRSRVFEDMSRVANGAAGVLAGARTEAEAALRARVERVLARMDVVPRDEFEAVREMAARARADADALAARVKALEDMVK